jgi:hypothetical protein
MMSEFPSSEAIDSMSLDDLEKLARFVDPLNESTAYVIRRYLMRKQEKELSAEQIEALKQNITVLDREKILENLQKSKPSLAGRFFEVFRSSPKFVREGERIIIFPDHRKLDRSEDGFMHIDYAVADGMKNPEDGGKIIFLAEQIITTNQSSSLHIPKQGGNARLGTKKVLQKLAPSNVSVVDKDYFGILKDL